MRFACRNSIPKGLRIKAQGCEPRATLGKRNAELSTPTGLRRIEANRQVCDEDPTPLGLGIPERCFPRVARSSHHWAGGRNPFGIEDACKEHLRYPPGPAAIIWALPSFSTNPRFFVAPDSAPPIASLPRMCRSQPLRGQVP